MTKHDGQQIGHIFVDSGQVMILDPCYIDEKWDGEFVNDKPGEFSYGGACTATLSEDGYGTLQKGMAFACGTRWGDGQYPVFATFDNEGRVLTLTVSFDDSPEMDECSRCGDEFEMGALEDGYCEPCAEFYAEDEDEEDDQ